VSTSLGILDSRVARRLLALFALCAVLPFLLASVAALRELTALSARGDAVRMHLLAKSYGMELAGRIAVADALLQAQLAHDAEGAGGTRIAAVRPGLLTGRQAIGTSPDGTGAGTAVSAWSISPAQLARLRAGQALLREVRAAPGGGTTLWLARARASAGPAVFAEVSIPVLLSSIDDFAGRSRVGVLIEGRELLGHSDAAPPAEMLAAARASIQGSVAAGAPRSRGSQLLEVDGDGAGVRAAVWTHPLAAAYLDGPTLQVVAWEPRKSLLATLGSLQLVFPGLMLGAVLLAVGVASAQLRRQLKPLDILTGAIRRVTARQFDAQIAIRSGDEFEELGDAFNRMSSALKREFETVEAMAEVDRLLLESQGLETVLDALLPRACRIAGCYSASVLLLDRDASGRARAYDFVVGMTDAMPVRRVMLDSAALAARMRGERSVGLAASEIAAPFQFLAAIAECGAARFDLHPLRREEAFAGILCLGQSSAEAPEALSADHALGLADRLSVALTNLSHGESLYREAHYDALTGLPNRRLFHQRVTEAMQQAREDAGRGGVLFVDLDHFKRVNDTAGHGVGDEILRCAAERIVHCCGRGDLAARLGGDEFAVLVPHVEDEDALAALADRILGAMKEAIRVGRREHQLGASIGIAVFPFDGGQVADLLRHADIAMYRAKEAGRNRAMFFEAEMNARMQGRVDIESGLHRAIRNASFELRFQPIVSAAELRLAGAEALLRWPDAPTGINGPTQFISIAEDSGLIVEMGEWALNTSLAALQSWDAAGLQLGYVSVNVSPRQLGEARFLERVHGAFARCRVEPRRVLFEITESVLADAETSRKALTGLAQLGARVAIDDFGTGYSSLSYLRALPIDAVKIDRSFITAVPMDASACKLVDTIVAMGHALGKAVIAEGVETQAQLEYLRMKRCDAAQGFLFSRPIVAGAFKDWAMAYVRPRAGVAARDAS
jgi:diguanylate cyclase (GGDEF)-like protein